MLQATGHRPDGLLAYSKDRNTALLGQQSLRPDNHSLQVVRKGHKHIMPGRAKTTT